MNKYKKILALVAPVLLCAVGQAVAKIGETQDQVIALCAETGRHRSNPHTMVWGQSGH